MKVLSSIMIAPGAVSGSITAFTVPLSQPIPIMGFPAGAPPEIEAMIKELALKIADPAFYRANLLLTPSLCSLIKAGEFGACLGSMLAQNLASDYIGEEADIAVVKRAVTVRFKVAAKVMHHAAPLGQLPFDFKPFIPIGFNDTVEVDVETDPGTVINLAKPLIVRFTLDGFGCGAEERVGESAVCEHCGGDGYLVKGKKSKSRRALR